MKTYYQVIIVIPLLLVIFLGLDCFFAISNAHASYTWNSTEGIIIQSNYTPQHDKTGENLDLTYSYTIGNQTYYSKNINPVGPFYVTYIIDNGIINKKDYSIQFPKGANVRVYYDPSNPSVSSLTQGWAFSNYVELCIFLSTVLSFLIAGFTYNKNPHLRNSFNVYERIIIQFLANYFLLIFSFIIVTALLFLYGFIILVLSFIITIFIVSIINLITNFLNSSIPKDILLTSIYYCLTFILLIKILFICIKAYKSISVRKFKKYSYELTNMTTDYDATTKKWLLIISFSFKISDQVMNVTHTVNRKFSSEAKAEKFFKKQFKTIDTTIKTDQRNFGSKPIQTLIQYYPKRIIYVPPSPTNLNQEVQFSAEIFPIVLIPCIPILFVIFDMIMGIAIKYIYYIGISIDTQLILQTLLKTNSLNQINIVYLSIFLVVIGTEVLFCVYIISLIVKIYYHSIYYNILWGGANY